MRGCGGEIKVLVFSFMYPNPVDSSAGVFVEEQVRHLANRCEIKVLSPAPWFPPVRLFRKWYAYRLRPMHEHRKGIEVFRPRFLSIPRDIFTTGALSYFLCSLPTALRTRRSFDFDIIHAHVAYPDGFAAVLTGKLLKKPVVITEHTGNFAKIIRKAFVRRILSLYALRNAWLVISVGRNQRDELLREGLNEDKVILIPNGVDLDIFRPMARDDTTKTSRIILFVGHLTEDKGVDFLLEAFRQMQAQAKTDLELLLVGNGARRERLARQARELGIDSKVHFLGVLDRAEVARRMRGCDLLVLPSLRESFGIVLIEAMACGKPVVATRCGGPEEMVTEDAGVLVSPRDARALAEAMKHVLENASSFRPEKVAERVRLKYDIQHVTRRIIESYCRVLQRS